MSAIAWGILSIGVLMSVASLNPIPFVICLVAALAGTGGTRKDVATIKAAGQNPDAPPMPTSGPGLFGCLLWLVIWTFIGFVAFASIVAMLEGGM